jgi:hypothetical protein
MTYYLFNSRNDSLLKLNGEIFMALEEQFKNAQLLTPIMWLQMAHDPGPARMEVFKSQCFQKYIATYKPENSTVRLTIPMLDIAQKLRSGQGVDLRQSLQGLPMKCCSLNPKKVDH